MVEKEIVDVPFMIHLYFAENTRSYFLSFTILIRQMSKGSTGQTILVCGVVNVER